MLFRDLWWWWRAKRRLTGSVDRVRMGARDGALFEVVSPRWWDVRRWSRWLRAPRREELTFAAKGGGTAFLVVRAFPASLPPSTWRPVRPEGLPMLDLAPTAPSIPPLDPRKRLVPDEVLEREGATIRDEEII